MLTAKEIKDKAERSYKDFLISVLRREIFFPFPVKGNKGNANLPLQDLYPALKHLIDNSKEKLGYGYSLTYKEVNTRHSGVITMPDAIFFENPVDYLKFIEKENDFLAFRKAVDLTKKQAPTLLFWLENNVLKCQKYATEWADFLKIAAYFTQNQNKEHGYWRQLPIEVDLPALEIHQPIISEILEAILPPSVFQSNETQFAPRFNLKYDEPTLRLRFLGETFLLPNIGDDIALPISVLNKMEMPCENVFFITDKNVFLSFPNIERADALSEIKNPKSEIKHPLSIAVFWEHHSDILLKLPSFHAKKGYFAGDISVKGFEQLSEMRSILPNLLSFLMDKITFETFPQHHETVKTLPNASQFLPNLTPEEQTFYQSLFHLKEKNGLSQRNVSHPFLKNRLKEL